jgi:phosphatidylinositol alpha-1,6-mannosyltransferase
MILFITRKYPPSVGGMQKLSHGLTTEVSRRTPAKVISWGGSQRWLPLWLVWAFARSLTILLRGRVTLIHIGDPVLAPLGVMLRALGQVPVAANAHGLDVIYPHPLYQAIVLPCLRRLDCVICISAHTKEECVRRGVRTERCVVIPPGIDVDAHVTTLSPGARAQRYASWGVDPMDRHVLLGVGRMVRRKGFAPFVSEALPQLNARRRDWICLIVGDGPERAAAEAAVEAHGLTEQVKLLGQLDDEAWRAAYALADLFVMPNIHVPGDVEGFGLVTLEARAAGLPVVGADLEGISEAFDDKRDGTLVPPGDWMAFAEAISDWLDRNGMSAQRESRRQRMRARFGWEQIATQYMAVFDRVKAEYRTRRRERVADRG